MGDWNNLIKRNRQYIKTKNKIKTQDENNKLQQFGLTENLQTLFQPILKSQEDIIKRLAPSPHKNHPEPIEYGGFIIRTFLHMIRKTGPETRRLKEVDLYIKAINQDDEYAEDNSIIQEIDNPITQQIDELEEEIAILYCLSER
ncbi:hypothetical protein LOTGIDRAFT_157269 [Lottia gigantea]|uniref:Uncharacterized protein n=1 Tax=Lottia gigantea TaxID=225164 RepID=V4ADN1_LOTGI|nr:hypothetical protein LOTGIDRAFT_157269 [Lottia gigantea]ESP02119.1 hypothetical protein LOTGIDRAFT_157269 [Lottia gigantea]